MTISPQSWVINGAVRREVSMLFESNNILHNKKFTAYNIILEIQDLKA